MVTREKVDIIAVCYAAPGMMKNVRKGKAGNSGWCYKAAINTILHGLQFYDIGYFPPSS